MAYLDAHLKLTSQAFLHFRMNSRMPYAIGIPPNRFLKSFTTIFMATELFIGLSLLFVPNLYLKVLNHFSRIFTLGRGVLP